MREGIGLIEVLIALVILALTIAIIFGAVGIYRRNFACADRFNDITTNMENAFDIARMIVRGKSTGDLADRLGISIENVGKTSDGCYIYKVSLESSTTCAGKPLPATMTTFYVLNCGD